MGLTLDPMPRDDFVRHYIIGILGCFPRGYFVLLGSRVRFELLKQGISPLSENVLIIVV